MTASPPARDVRERLARMFAACACAAPDCRHPVIDANAWQLADVALAEIAAWQWAEADHALEDCASRPACGRCAFCHTAERHAETAVTLETLRQGLPPAGHPESTTTELDEATEEALAGLASELWPNDDYLTGGDR